VWNFTVPVVGSYNVGGVAYDAARGLLYVSVQNADTQQAFSSLPLIEVFRVTVPLGTPGRVAPQIGTLAATPSTLVPGPIPAGTSVDLTAGNVYALNSGISVSNVAFYLDTNNDGILEVGTDQLLGNGTPSSVPNAGHNWVRTIATSGLSAGNYTIFAQAQDSGGLFSFPITTTLTIA
jgi:hypothetical protein